MLGPREKDLTTFKIFFSTPCGPLKFFLWGLAHSKVWEKKPKSLSTGDWFFFEKFGSGFLRSWKIHLTTCKIIFRTPCWPFKIISWGLSHSKAWEKKPKTFVNGRLPFFEKFGSGLLRSDRTHHTACKILVKTPFNAPSNCELTFVMFDNTRKKRPNSFFFTGQFAFFSKACVFNVLLGVTDLILWRSQYLSENFGEPYRLLPEVGRIR